MIRSHERAHLIWMAYRKLPVPGCRIRNNSNQRGRISLFVYKCTIFHRESRNFNLVFCGSLHFTDNHRLCPAALRRVYLSCVITGALLKCTQDISNGLNGTVAQSSAGWYWVRISIPVPAQSGVLNAQWVGGTPLHSLLV